MRPEEMSHQKFFGCQRGLESFPSPLYSKRLYIGVSRDARSAGIDANVEVEFVVEEMQRAVAAHAEEFAPATLKSSVVMMPSFT